MILPVSGARHVQYKQRYGFNRKGVVVMNREFVRASSRRDFFRQSAAVMAALTLVPRAARAESGGGIAPFSCDITPPLGTPWYPSYGPLGEIEHPLLAKGVVLEDAGGRYVLCALDYCELRNSAYDRACATLAEAAGTTPDRVAVHTVHQHTAPMVDPEAFALADTVASPPPHPDFTTMERLLAQLAETVRTAASQMVPWNRVGTGRARVERVASNRRVRGEDGKILTRFSSCKDPKLVEAPEGLVDPWLKTVTFARDDTPLVRLHYYATHPQSFYGDTRSTYDFPGMAREWLERREGIPQVYFTGCAGNIAAGKYNNGTPEAREGLYLRLRAAMETAARATAYEPAQPITWRTTSLQLEPITSGELAPDALMAALENTAHSHNIRLDAAMCRVFQERTRKPFLLTALDTGKLVLIHLPGEMAVEFQLYAQTIQPDRFVAVAAYGDCAPSYVNPASFFQEGGYEASASLVVPESEQRVLAAIRQLAGLPAQDPGDAKA